MFARIATEFRRAGEGMLNLLYPPHCAVCRTDTLPNEHLCDACRKEARHITSPACHVCSEPFSGAVDSPFVCPNCQDRKFRFECAIAPYRSQGPVREIIHQFKYGRWFYLRHLLAEWLAESLCDERLRGVALDGIVPVPLHPARQRERGFNQAQVLAELLAKRSGLPLLDCLRRVRYTTTQTQFDRRSRMENLREAFCVRKSADVSQRHLLLIDDVLTTGATVDECAAALKKVGAATVHVATVARGGSN